MTHYALHWPFPLVNGERTPESKALMASKPVKPIKDNMEDLPDAIF